MKNLRNIIPCKPAGFWSGGSSLVEVLVAVVILAVLATGGTAFMFHSKSQVVIQENRRVALEVANARLEELRATPYTTLELILSKDFKVNYLYKQLGIWVRTKDDPQRTIEVNGQMLPIATTAQFMDADGGSSSRDLIKLRVEVGYRANNDDRVTLESFYSQ